jgi:hypothetical protein
MASSTSHNRAADPRNRAAVSRSIFHFKRVYRGFMASLTAFHLK